MGVPSKVNRGERSSAAERLRDVDTLTLTGRILGSRSDPGRSPASRSRAGGCGSPGQQEVDRESHAHDGQERGQDVFDIGPGRVASGF